MTYKTKFKKKRDLQKPKQKKLERIRSLWALAKKYKIFTKNQKKKTYEMREREAYEPFILHKREDND
jgi:hypothetical protein